MLRLPKVAVVLCCVVVGGILGSPPAAALPPNTVTVAYDPDVRDYTVTPTSLSIAAGATFTLRTTMTDNASSFVSLSAGTGSVTLAGTSCVVNTDCPVYDTLPGGGTTQTFTVVTTGTLTVWRHLNGEPDVYRNIGTLTIGSSSSAGSTTKPTVVMAFDPGSDENGHPLNCRNVDYIPIRVTRTGPDGGSYALPDAECLGVYPGHSLLGWSHKPGQSKADANLTPGAVVRFAYPGGTMYAVWGPGATIRYHDDLPDVDIVDVGRAKDCVVGGQYVGYYFGDLPVQSVGVLPGRDPFASLPYCRPRGAAFLGWSTSADATKSAYLGGETVPSASTGRFSLGSAIDLYPVWQPQVTVSYDSNAPAGVECQITPTEYVVAIGTALKATVPCQPSGYTFLGWSTDASATSAAFAPGAKAKGAPFIQAAKVELFGVWRHNPATLQFDSESASCDAKRLTGAAPSAISAFVGDTVTLPGNGTLACAGKVFTGWNSAANGKGIAYRQFGNPDPVTVTLASSTTLYPVWEEPTITLTAGASSLNPLTYTSVKATVTLGGKPVPNLPLTLSAGTNMILGAYPNMSLTQDVTTDKDGAVSTYAWALAKPFLLPSAVVATSRLSMSGDIRRVAITPDGQRLFVTSGSDQVLVIDAATGSLLWTVAVGSRPTRIIVSPDGSHAYVANHGGESVSVIDTILRTVVATVPLPGRAFGLAVSPQGDRVYVSHSSGLTAGECSNGGVSVLDAKTNKVTATTRLGQCPEALAMSPDGRRLFVADLGLEKVFSMSLPSLTPVATLLDGVWAESLSVSPDGQRLFVAKWDKSNYMGLGSILSVSTQTGRELARLADSVIVWTGATMSADGRRVFVQFVGGDASGNDPGVQVVDAGAGGVLSSVPTRAFSPELAASPDGLHAFQLGVPGGGQPGITIVGPAGSVSASYGPLKASIDFAINLS